MDKQMCHIDTMEFSNDNKQEGISTDASPSTNLENILVKDACPKVPHILQLFIYSVQNRQVY